MILLKVLGIDQPYCLFGSWDWEGGHEPAVSHPLPPVMCGTRLLAPHKRGGAGHLQFSSVAEDLDLEYSPVPTPARVPMKGRRRSARRRRQPRGAGRPGRGRRRRRRRGGAAQMWRRKCSGRGRGRRRWWRQGKGSSNPLAVIRNACIQRP